MKKSLLSVALMATMGFAAQAQFKITPKVGYMLSKVAYSDKSQQVYEIEGNTFKTSSKLKSGFALGAAFEIPVSDVLSFQPELMYIQKGEKTTASFDFPGFFSGKYEVKTTLNYIEMPLLLKATFGDEDNVRFFGYVGPYFGYALNGKAVAKVSAFGQSDSQTTKIKFGDKESTDDEIYLSKDDANRLDIGAYVGAGVSLPAGPGALSLEARYGYGFTNFAKDKDASKEELKSQNRVVGIFLGYSLPLGSN